MNEWKTVKLGDVCEPRQWKTLSIQDLESSGYPVYGANGIIGYYSDYNHEKPTLMVTCRGATCGSINVSEPFSWINGNAMCLDNLNTKIDLKYLEHYLKNYDFRNVISGSAQPQIIRENINKVQIRIYTLAEQKHIAAILDKTQKIIAEHKQMLQKYDTLIKSRFIEMFGDPHNNTKYTYKTVGDFTTVTSGGTPDRKNIEYWKNGNIPWVKTTELQNNELTNVEEFITQKGLDESSAKMMPIGTLLIAMYGQGKTRGMTAYLGIEASTNQACACILPSKVINQKFLWYYFILSYDKLRDLAKGGNQPNLNGNMIKDFPVLMPPIEMQNEYVSFVQQIDKSKFAVQKSLEKTETLYKSLMQQYFG